MKNQPWMMLICCLLPLLLIFVAPSLGLNKGNALFIFIPVMLLACFVMMGKGGGGCCGSHHDAVFFLAAFFFVAIIVTPFIMVNY